MKNKGFFIILGIVAFLLLIPLIAMQFTEEVRWSLTDFVVAGVLLLGSGFLCDLALRKINKKSYQIAIVGAILVLLLLIWAELAVGIFGTPMAGS
ncbi:MAG: hypothetical protein MUO53_01515 [Maribacter sp.]|nr:hypothetical protein [Maribacter sp.]